MAKFTDNAGREWSLTINVAALKRVRMLAEVDLADILATTLLQRLAGDPVLLAEVLYAVCQPQAERQGISPESFGEELVGDVIDAATTALLEALADFFPSRRRAALRKALAKVKSLEETALTAAERTLDSDVMDRVLAEELAPERIEAELKDALSGRRTSGTSSTAAPGSSAATPGPSPSGS